MMTSITAYIYALIGFLIADGIWLSVMSSRFYRPALSHLMGGSFVWWPVALFYPLYTLALVLLVVLPALRGGTPLLTVFLLGALLGLAAYGAYDFTNHATLREWPPAVTVVDLLWGALVTGGVALLTVWVLRLLN